MIGIETTSALRCLGRWRTLCAALATASAVGLAGCGGANGDTSAPAAAASAATTAADITLALSSATLLDSGTDTVTATVTAVDANRNLIAGVPVTISVDNAATALVSRKVTDANGVVTAAIGVGAERANRVITVSATSNGVVRTAAVQVTGAKLLTTALPASLAPSSAGTVRFRLTDNNSNPMAQQAIVVNGVGGVEVSAKTDNNGEYLYAYTAPATTGTLDIRATAGGVTSTQSVQVQPVASIANAISSPPLDHASVGLSSGTVAANSTVTNHQIEVRALFLRETNQPAERVRVRFDLAGDINNVGGRFSAGSTLLYSDVAGVVRTSFIPGARTSPNDGVTIRACWDYTDFAVGACPRQATTQLTVVSEPLSVSIGTNNLIEIGGTSLDYVKRYLVQVNDASGAPKADVQLTAVLDLPRYSMGFYFPVTTTVLDIVYQEWVQRVVWQCDNEDLNRNASIDSYSNGAVEDANKNGQLDPRKADVVATFEGPSKTNASGQAVLKITYPQSSASWVTFNLSVIAGGVLASEGRASFSSVLPVLDRHVRAITELPPTPAFVVSPYNVPDYQVVGVIRQENVVNPDGKSGVLCKRN